MALDVLPRARDGHAVEQAEQSRRQLVQQLAGITAAALRPIGKASSCAADQRAQVGHAQVRETISPVGGNQVELGFEIAQIVVHRRSREQQNLGRETGLDDLVHQPLVAAAASACGLVPGCASEIMGLVDDNEIVVAPFDPREVNVADLALLTRKISMRQDGVTEPIFAQRVHLAVVRGEVIGPVLAQLLRAQHEHVLVALLEPLDDGQSGEGFAQTDTVGEDAAAMLFDLGKHGAQAIALEIEQRAPNRGLLERRLLDQRLFCRLVG